MKSKVVVLFVTILMFVSSIGSVNLLANEGTGSGYDIEMILDCINEPEPINFITKNGETAVFTYDGDKKRLSKEIAEQGTIYEYSGDMLISEKRNDIQISYLYGKNDLQEEICTGLLYNGKTYWYGYDEEGRINYILDEVGNYICEYVYNEGVAPAVYEFTDTGVKLNESLWFIGNVNPLRYYGWYYDQEIMCYYLGKGVYYDISTNEYINNEYSLNEIRLHELFSDSTRNSTMPDIVYEIISDYTLKMGSQTYGATDYESVSESAWKQGKRWYDGIDEAEVIARCIFGENDGIDRENDRIAEAVVIANRVAEERGGQTTAYGVVTARSQFSTINPGNYSSSVSETKRARKALNKTEARTQQAILLAVTVCHTIDHSEMSLIYKFPEYIEKQTEFLGLNAVKSKNWMSVQGNQWYYGSQAIKNVVLAGEVKLSSPGNTIEILDQYEGYNIFFNYGTEK